MRYKHKIILFSSILFTLLCAVYFVFVSNFFSEEAILRDISCIDCNIIYITLDTLRADHLSLYGYERNTSPNIDNFAKESVVYNNAFSNAFFTLPSHMSTFTSLYPLKHRINSANDRPLSENFTTFAEVLQKNNYTTIWSAPLEDPNLSPAIGFGRGFDELLSAKVDNIRSINKDFFSEVFNQNKNNKFFLFVHSYIDHAPYIYSGDYNYKFSNPNYEGSLPVNRLELTYAALDRLNMTAADYFEYISMSNHSTYTSMSNETKKELFEILNSKDLLKYEEFIKKNIPRYEPLFFLKTTNQRVYRTRTVYHPDDYSYFGLLNSIDDFIELGNRYDNGIVFADYIVGELLHELKQHNLMNNTIIIIAGDHGEELGEHGGYNHLNFYDHTIHVPLIIKVPGLSKGFRIDSLVQSVDVMPTILNLINVSSPNQVQGKNILTTNSVNKYVFGFASENRYIRSQEWKYIITRNDYEELYYLIEDPLEQNNLINSNKSAIIQKNKELKDALEKWTLEQIT